MKKKLGEGEEKFQNTQGGAAGIGVERRGQGDGQGKSRATVQEQG